MIGLTATLPEFHPRTGQTPGSAPVTAPVVVHFIETGIPGGAESFLIDLCAHQRSAGLRPMIAHFAHPYFMERCHAEGIETFPMPARESFKRIWTLPHFIGDFSRRLKAENVALLHSHLFGPIVGGTLAAAVSRLPHVGTLHDIHMVEDAPRRMYQLQMCTLLGSRLVAVSKQMEQFYKTRLHVRKSNVSCIYNGVTLRACKAISRGELQIPERDIVAVVVGRLVPLKRVQDAIVAIANLVSVNITLLVVGTGPARESLEACARQRGIGGKVRFLGQRHDVPAILQLADIFVQCSDTEGLSMSILEALVSGLPCVVSNVGGNAELVVDGVNGALFEARDTERLTVVLQDLCTNEAKRGAYSSHAEQAREIFSLSRCAAEYMKLYAALDRQTFE